MIGSMLLEAWRAMGANKMRTFLTMLGMVIGVGAVILMLAIGAGAQKLVRDSIASMGSNLIMVLAGYTSTAGVRSGSGNVPSLTLNDAQAIAELPSVMDVAPLQPGSSQLVYGANNWNTVVYGTTPSYFPLRDWIIERGEPFSDTDVKSAARVAIVGHTVVDRLFGDEDPIGRTLRIRNAPFVVTGVLAPKGQSFDGRDQDDTVVIPISTAQRKVFGSAFPDSVRLILVQAWNEKELPIAESEVNALLRERTRTPEGMEPNFTVRNLTAAAQAQAQTTRVMSILLGSVACVSLVVGGIGIMNIMLVSVTERTREIGIRMAIGARRRDILLQFLLEAVIVSLLGCLIGVALGVTLSTLAQSVTGIYAEVSAWSIALSFLVATFVGVFFGFYPARKAANLKPIEALRFQ